MQDFAYCTMSQFLSSDVALLVLGYLEDTKCLKSYNAFFHESPDLEECRKMVSGGVKYRRGKETLLSILQDYCDLTSNGLQSSKSFEKTRNSAPPLKDSQRVKSVIKSDIRRVLFEGENRPRTKNVVFLHSPVRKSILGGKTIPAVSKRTGISPVAAKNRGKSLSYVNGFHIGDMKTLIAEKPILAQEDNPGINKTPHKNNNSITSNVNHDKVDRYRAVCVGEQDLQQRSLVLSHITTSSPSAHQAEDLLCDITQIETVETCSVTSESSTNTLGVASIMTTPSVSSRIANESLASSWTPETSTPEYNGNPPAYTTCPASVDSPRYILSDERLAQASIVTPMKDVHNLRYDYGESPKRKRSIIPRRRVISERSPEPRHSSLTEITNFSNFTVYDDIDQLANLDEMFNVSTCAERIADTINKMKSSDRQEIFASDLLDSSKSDRVSTSQRNYNLINESIGHCDVAEKEEKLIYSSGKLEHSKDHTSNLHSNLLGPIKFASYEKSEDISGLGALVERTEHIPNNAYHVQIEEIQERNHLPLPQHVQLSETQAAEASLVKTQVPETTEMVPETILPNNQTHSEDLIEILEGTANKEQHQLDMSVPTSFQPQVLTSNALPYIPDNLESKDSDPTQIKLDILKPTKEIHPALNDLTSYIEEFGSSLRTLESTMNAQNTNCRSKRGRKPVAKRTNDTLNQAEMETNNCKPSCNKKKSTLENKLPDVSLPSSAFTPRPETAQNNTMAYLCHVPGAGNTPPTYVLVYSDMHTNGNVISGCVPAPSAESIPNAISSTAQPVSIAVSPVVQSSFAVIPPVQSGSITIPSAAQQTCITINSGIDHQAISALPQIDAATPHLRSNSINIHTVRRNAFDPPDSPNQNKNLTLLTQMANNQLNKLKPRVETPHHKVQNYLPNEDQKDLDSEESVIVLSSLFPSSLSDCELKTQLSCNQGIRKVSNSISESLTPVKVNMSEDATTFQFLTISPGQLQSLQQSYIGGCKLPTRLPMVPGLDLSNQEQGVLTKRKHTTTDENTEPRPKRRRPAMVIKKNKKSLLQNTDTINDTYTHYILQP